MSCPETYTIEVGRELLTFRCGVRGRHRYHKANHGLRAQIEWLSNDDLMRGLKAMAGVR